MALSPSLSGVGGVLFRANADRRHHIPRQRHRVTSSAAYDAALRQRGSLTVWSTDAAIAAWTAEARTVKSLPNLVLAHFWCRLPPLSAGLRQSRAE